MLIIQAMGLEWKLKAYKVLLPKCVDLDEVAHDEPPHQDLLCLQIQLFSSLVLKELNVNRNLICIILKNCLLLQVKF